MPTFSYVARDQKTKRNAPEDKALKVQAFKSLMDIFGIASDRDLSQRRDILDETRKVDKINIEIFAQIIDEPLQDKAIGQVGVDKDKVLFFAIPVQAVHSLQNFQVQRQKRYFLAQQVNDVKPSHKEYAASFPWQAPIPEQNDHGEEDISFKDFWGGREGRGGKKNSGEEDISKEVAVPQGG